jgi:hypothetical protein
VIVQTVVEGIVAGTALEEGIDLEVDIDLGEDNPVEEGSSAVAAGCIGIGFVEGMDIHLVAVGDPEVDTEAPHRGVGRTLVGIDLAEAYHNRAVAVL